ncbi:MAG TPA: OmpH family outer membrane protein [Gemmatimonadota bacterium]|nr:OmpH family outer membrane protein [Gemmatimonadota bacterium]
MFATRGVFGALLLLAVAPVGTAAQDAPLRIAYIDSEEIVKQAPGYSEANAEFNRTASGWQDSLEQKRGRLKELYDEYKAQEVILSPEKKAERQEEMLRMEGEIQQYFQIKFGPQGEASTRQAELMQPIIERVNRVIDQARQELGYSLIFDLNDGALVAGDPALNITDEVIRRLQSSQGVAAPSR